MDDTIKILNSVLLFAGISIFSKENWNNKLWYRIQLFDAMVLVATCIFSSGFMIVNSSDILRSIQGACAWSAVALTVTSILTCFVFRSNFHAFTEEIIFKDFALEIPLIEHIMLVIPKGRNLKILKTLVINSQDNLSKVIKYMFISYLSSCIVGVTLYILEPMYIMWDSDDDSLRLLAFDFWFPWGLENYMLFVASSVFSAYAGFLFCIIIPGLQSLITLLLGQVIRQMTILTFILLHLNEIAQESVEERGGEWRGECTLILTTCFRHYVNVRRFLSRLDVTCQLYYLFVLLDVTLIVCVVSVKISISKFSLEIIKYYIQVSVFILMILLLCCLGQQVENKREQLEEAVSEKWYIFDRKHKFHVQMFMVAAGQKMPIYIFGSVTLSLITFTWFAKTGMSFFTMVMSFLEE